MADPIDSRKTLPPEPASGLSSAARQERLAGLDPRDGLGGIGAPAHHELGIDRGAIAVTGELTA